MIDLDGEIERREEFGVSLGRVWEPLRAFKDITSFREFAEIIAQTPVWDEVDFIVLSTAYKEIERIRKEKAS